MEAKGDIVCTLDSDIYVPHDWISSMLKHYTSNEIRAVGSYNRLELEEKKEVRETHALPFFCSSFRRKILKELGDFSYVFESEFYMNIKSKGYKILCDDNIIVMHDHPRSFVVSCKTEYIRGIKLGKIIKKLPHVRKYLSKWFLFPPLWVVIVLKYPFLPMFKETIKETIIRLVHNLGKFIGYVKS